MELRILKTQDWQAWKALRLEALKNAPEYLDSSYAEEASRPAVFFQTLLNRDKIFAAFMGAKLAA